MRLVFLLLVFANALFFAWSRYVAPEEASVDRAPLDRQIEPEKLPIIAPPTVSTSTPKAAAALAACVEWGSFSPTELDLAQKALEPLALGTRLTERREEETAGWWIFIPPQGNRQAALRKAAELKALGVEEFFIVQEESALRWAVSLGVFRGEGAAHARLSTLRERGVRSAQVGPREASVVKVWLQIRDVTPDEQGRLKPLAESSTGSVLRTCGESQRGE